MNPAAILRRRGLAAVLAAAAIVPLAPGRGASAAEPGPVPLFDPAVPDSPPTAAAPASRPAGLGDWRLAAALATTFAALLVARHLASRRAQPLPPDVFEVLGVASLGGQQTVRIVRFGPKTLLVGTSAAGAVTLAEIGDPQATARIAAACRGVQPRQAPGPRRATQAAPSAPAAPPAEAA